jgi:hypothetical protein
MKRRQLGNVASRASTSDGNPRTTAYADYVSGGQVIVDLLLRRQDLYGVLITRRNAPIEAARATVAALGLLDTGAEEGVRGVPVGLVDPAGVLEQQLTGGSGTVREIRTDVPDKLDGDVRAASASIRG